MPIYEYRCSSCQAVSSFFTRSITTTLVPVCGHCQSRDMVRRMSTFAMGKPAQSVQEKYSPGTGQLASDYYGDPRNIGRHVEEGFARHSLDMPPSVRESIDAARQGELPKGLDK